jgi:hypothetical protein
MEETSGILAFSYNHQVMQRSAPCANQHVFGPSGSEKSGSEIGAADTLDTASSASAIIVFIITS